MSDICFFVPGSPAPGGSKTGYPRQVQYFDKKTKKMKNRIIVNMVPASKYTKPWMKIVRDIAKSEYRAEPLSGPIHLTMRFRILRPKYHYGTGRNARIIKSDSPIFPTCPPDLTKYVRSTEDALTGVLWIDDGQVVKGEYTKEYCSEKPGVVILIREVSLFQ